MMNKVAKPYPKRKPLITLLRLLLSYLVRLCAKPSIIRGKSKIKQVKTSVLRKGYNTKAKIIPIKTPVHLAQTGNLTPFI